VLRDLVLGTVVFVSFAATDNVALVFLVMRSLRGSAAGYGAATAAFGAGMATASLGLAAWGTAGQPRTGSSAASASLGALDTAATGPAPAIFLACAAWATAGAGNTADLVGTDTLIQQSVPAGLPGRAVGGVCAAAQLASSLAYAAAGSLVMVTGARATFLIAGTGMLAGLAVIGPALISTRHGPPGRDDPALRPALTTAGGSR